MGLFDYARLCLMSVFRSGCATVIDVEHHEDKHHNGRHSYQGFDHLSSPSGSMKKAAAKNANPTSGIVILSHPGKSTNSLLARATAKIALDKSATYLATKVRRASEITFISHQYIRP